MNKIMVSCLVIAFLIGSASCAGIQLKEDPTQTQITISKVSARTAGYLIGKNNPDEIDKWSKWASRILALESGETPIRLEVILADALDYVEFDAFLRQQIEDLITLFDLPQLQPPEFTFLTSQYLVRLRIIISAFVEGLIAAKAIE